LNFILMNVPKVSQFMGWLGWWIKNSFFKRWGDFAASPTNILSKSGFP
jgi:hypothetical protein